VSAEHKRPLFAFAAVMVVCVMIVAHAVHSQALDGFLRPIAPAVVAAGPHLIPAPSPPTAATEKSAEIRLGRGSAGPSRKVVRRPAPSHRAGRKTRPAASAAPAAPAGPGRTPSEQQHAGAPPGGGKALGAQPKSHGKAGHGPRHTTHPGRGHGQARGKGHGQARSRGHGQARGKGHGRAGRAANGSGGSGSHGRRR
jgi:DNA polymerase-3 subunit gamma/tau